MTHSDIIKVNTIRCANHHAQGVEITQTETILNNTKEGFNIAVRTHGEDCQVLEVAQITISFPGQKEWVGTIQDFMAIFSVCTNAKCLVSPLSDHYTHASWLELKNVLSHLKSSVPVTPSAI